VSLLWLHTTTTVAANYASYVTGCVFAKDWQVQAAAHVLCIVQSGKVE
jgi:hypothetical protein